VALALGCLILGGCVGAASSSGAAPTPAVAASPGVAASPSVPAAVAPPPAAAAPGSASPAPVPSASGSLLGRTGACSSTTQQEPVCSGGPLVPPPAGAASFAPTPPTATTPAAPTPAVTRVPPAPPTPVPSPGTPAASPIVVTGADNGTVLHLAVGQEFLLDLGASVDWAATVADQDVVGLVRGVLVIRGAQGIYVARTPGTTLLSAVGSPHCSSGACPLYRLGFRLTITVS